MTKESLELSNWCANTFLLLGENHRPFHGKLFALLKRSPLDGIDERIVRTIKLACKYFPSPGGEGQDEGERSSKQFKRKQFTEVPLRFGLLAHQITNELSHARRAEASEGKDWWYLNLVAAQQHRPTLDRFPTHVEFSFLFRDTPLKNKSLPLSRLPPERPRIMTIVCPPNARTRRTTSP